MCTCVHDSLSPKGAKSQQGNAHIALLSSLGYNNESNCVFALVHVMRLLLPVFPARSALERAGALHAKLPPNSEPEHFNIKRDAHIMSLTKIL